jgi:hypothetical protein
MIWYTKILNETQDYWLGNIESEYLVMEHLDRLSLCGINIAHIYHHLHEICVQVRSTCRNINLLKLWHSVITLYLSSWTLFPPVSSVSSTEMLIPALLLVKGCPMLQLALGLQAS